MDLIPRAVLAFFQNLAGGLTRHLSDDLTVLARLLADIQIAVHTGNTDIFIQIQNHGAHIQLTRLVQGIADLHIIFGNITGLNLQPSVRRFLLDDIPLIPQSLSHHVRVCGRLGTDIQRVHGHNRARRHELHGPRPGFIAS